MIRLCQLWIWAFRDSLPSSSPSFLSPSLPPSLSPGPHPLNQLGGWGSAVSSPSGVWGEVPADKRFGAYLSQKEQLWWQQFLCIFIRINLNFCTNTRLLSSRYSVSLRGSTQLGPVVKPLVRGLVGGRSPLKLIILMTFCNLMHKFVKQV